MRASLPVRGEPGLREAEYGPGAEELARQLVVEAERTSGEARRRVVNQMHVLHELHVFFPGVQLVEGEGEAKALTRGGDEIDA